MEYAANSGYLHVVGQPNDLALPSIIFLTKTPIELLKHFVTQIK
jgi:hypothetical protein